MKKVFLNGESFDFKDAKISVFDRGFLFGDAIYEVARSYGRIFYRLDEHINRLFASAESLQMNLGKSQAQVIEEIYSQYKQIDADDFYMRLQVTRGQGEIGMEPTLAGDCNFVYYYQPFQAHSSEYYKKGVSLALSKRQRNPKAALDPNIKSGNYLNNVLAHIDGKKFQAYETAMVNSEGLITECCTSNLFIVKNEEVYTAPDDSDILRGITRQVLFDVAKSSGISIHQKYFSAGELLNADEVFITSSTREVMPVCQINGEPFERKSDVVKKLHELYKADIANYVEKAKGVHPWQ